MATRTSGSVTTQPRNIDGVIRTSQRTIKKRPNRSLLILITTVLLIVIATILLFFISNRGPGDLKDVKTIERKAARHYLLPSNEDPALATVTDSSKLQKNFVAKLQNGDKILIYAGIKRAIVYRPSLDRIIDVEPVNIGSDTSTSSDSTAIPNINPFGN